MEQKPAFVWILIILWGVIGILFLLSLITYTAYYFEQLNSSSGYYFHSDFGAMTTFTFVLYFILFLFMVVFSFLLVYGTIMKKSWSWLISMMISSFSGFFMYLGIQALGSAIIMDYFDQIFSTLYTTFQYSTYILMIFLVPILLVILTRPQVRTYFVTNNKINTINPAYPINRN